MTGSLRDRLFYLRIGLLVRGTVTFRKELAFNMRRPADELRYLNWERRKRIVDHAFRTVPFYQKRYSAVGFEPGDLKNEEDFSELPILERSHIRENLDDLISRNFHKNELKPVSTGGTTGAPITIFSDPRYPLNVISWRTLETWGVSPADNSAYLYRAIPTGISKVLRSLALYPTRRSYLSAFAMSDENLDRFFKALQATRPKYLVGYVGALDVFASYLFDSGLELPGLRAVWSTAAPLSDVKKNFFQTTFGCPVFSQYGSCEFYWIASECHEQSGLHIDSDIRHVEVVDSEDTPCETREHGDLIVTDLLNEAFPLIRYRVGDRGRMLAPTCACGSPFPLMDYVKGRVSDTITLRSGKKIPGEIWTTIFDDFVSEIRSFSVHQSADYRIRVYFEPYGENPSAVLEEVRQRLSKHLDEKTEIEFLAGTHGAIVGGKPQFVTSDVG